MPERLARDLRAALVLANGALVMSVDWMPSGLILVVIRPPAGRDEAVPPMPPDTTVEVLGARPRH